MKKFLNKFLLIAMAFVLACSVMGCKKKKKDSTSESTYVPPVQSESLPAVTDPVVPADGVDVSAALDLFAPILGNAYTNITIEATVDAVADSQVVAMDLDGAIHLKMTGKGYDAVAEISASYNMYGEAESVAAKLWFVDGLAVFGVQEGADPMEYAKMQVGNVNEVLSQMNQMIANDPSAKEVYEIAMPILEEVIATIEEAGITKTAIDETIDYKALYEQVIGHVIANQDMDMYTWVLQFVLGVNPSDTSAVTAFENSLLAIGEGNPTVALALDRVVALINNYLPSDAQVSLRQIVDELQALSCLTTAEIVQMVNEYMFGELVYNPATNEYTVVVDPELAFPTPEEGVSLYDYVYAMLNTYSLSALLDEMGYDSLEELIADGKEELQSYTVGEVFTELMGLYFPYANEEWVYTPGEGDYEYDAYDDSYYYVGYGGDYSLEYVPIDYVEMIEELDLDIDNWTLNFKYTPDSKGRPTVISYTIGADVALAMDGVNHTISQDAFVKLTFTYSKPTVSFEIPADALSNAYDMGSAYIA